VRNILSEAKKLGTVNYVAVEGGEPFLYYPIMVKAVKEAVDLGFHVEVLSNCYWATCLEDAIEWLTPIAEAKNVELSLSCDLYHGEKWETEEAKNAAKAAKLLKIKAGVISVRYPNLTSSINEIEGTKVSSWELMYKGRAFSNLTDKTNKKPFHEFTKCPYEDFTKQERVHIDPLGYVHACQGISIGNAWQKPFSKIIASYSPYQNPILEPLVRGGPAALVETFGLPLNGAYADACHLCTAARLMLRDMYPNILAPDQMYGKFG
jgi:MoaA/NifB/PqqE/SkfB family radical SAM enzyme